MTKAPSQRQLRVGELIRHALAGILLRGDIADPALTGAQVTITEVRLSPDLRHATVYVAAISGDAGKIAEALSHHRKYLRGELGRQVTLKYMPDLTFRRDETAETAAQIEALLLSPKVARDLK